MTVIKALVKVMPGLQRRPLELRRTCGKYFWYEAGSSCMAGTSGSLTIEDAVELAQRLWPSSEFTLERSTREKYLEARLNELLRLVDRLNEKLAERHCPHCGENYLNDNEGDC
jgi:hypothetical protein